MDEVKAKLRYFRIAPRKMRLLADLVRGMSLKEAIVQLNSSKKQAAPFLSKLLKSAEGNARNSKMNTDNLYIKEVRVDEGNVLKRHMPRARGRATVIKKRTSHVTVVLAEQSKKL